MGGGNKRYRILAVGMIVMFVIGIIYAWSVLKVPLQEEFFWSASQLALNFTLMMCMFCIGGMVSGIILSKIPLRVILLLAGCAAFAGFFGASKVDIHGITFLYLSYGILAGLGIGIGYNAVISVINEWFPDKRGTSSGALMMSFGASALFFGKMADVMIGIAGWRKTYQLLGICCGVVLVLAAFIMGHPEASMEKTGFTEKNDLRISGCTPKEMLSSPEFYRLFFFLVLACAVGNSTISMARDVAVDAGADVKMASTMAGILSLCNGCGRLFSGMMFDRCGQRKTMIMDGVITMIAPVIMIIAIKEHSVLICGIGLCITGLSYSFQPPVTSSTVASIYGMKYFSINYSITNLLMIPASFVATFVGIIYTKTNSFVGSFAVLFICAVLSFCLNLGIKDKKT